MSNPNEQILKDLKENHNVNIEMSPDIDALMNYVRHIAYNEGWKAHKNDQKSETDDSR